MAGMAIAGVSSLHTLAPLVGTAGGGTVVPFQARPTAADPDDSATARTDGRATPTGGPPASGASAVAAQEARDGDATAPGGPGGLTPEEEREVERLKQRDAEVRRHEQAHVAAGGPYAGSPTYEFQRGPDGKQYAIGGEVQIDVAPVPDNPQATITKMEVVKRAALAPAEPSGQDRKVAQEADQKKSEAQQELREQRRREANGEDPEGGPGIGPPGAVADGSGPASGGGPSAGGSERLDAAPATVGRAIAAYGRAAGVGQPAAIGGLALVA